MIIFWNYKWWRKIKIIIFRILLRNENNQFSSVATAFQAFTWRSFQILCVLLLVKNGDQGAVS